MWPIPKPRETSLSVFDCCLEGISDPDLKRRLRDARNRVVEAENEFDHREPVPISV